MIIRGGLSSTWTSPLFIFHIKLENMAIANNEIRIRVNDYTLPSITTGDTAANPIMKTYFVEDGWVVYEFNDTVTKVPANFVKNCANVIDFEIPPTCTTLRSNCFAYTNITSAVIPTTVQTVEGSIFYYCKSLTYAKCSPTEDWGNYVFAYADQLKTVDLVGATYIPSYFFYECRGLEQIEIPSTVTGIGNDVFYWNDSLNSIKCYGMELPVISGTSLGFAVNNNAGVLSFKDGADTKDWLTYLTRWSTGVLDADSQAQETVKPLPTVLPEYTYAWSMRVKNSTGTIVIPKEQAFLTESGGSNIPYKTFLIDGWSVYCLNSVPKFLSNSSFLRRDLVEIDITDGLEDIGDYAFQYNDKLREIVIPDSVRIIQGQAFGGSSGVETELTAITLGSGLTDVSYYAFENHLNLQTITCTAVVAPKIDYRTFYNIKRGGTLFYPDGSDYSSWLGTDAFYLGYYGWTKGIPVASVLGVKNSTGTLVSYKGATPFIGVDNTRILPTEYLLTTDGWTIYKFTEQLYKIDDAAFYDCDLVEIDLPDGLFVIGNQVFQNNNKIKEVIIPDNVTTIGNYAFCADNSNDRSLTGVTFGSSLTEIGTGAFMNQSNLWKIVISATIAPTIQNDTFYGVKSDGALAYPVNADYSSWLRTDEWYLGYYNWNQGVNEIWVRWSYNGVGEINVGDFEQSLIGTETRINEWDGEEWLVYKFNMPITRLGSQAFNMSGKEFSISHIILPNTLTEFGDDCFYNCGELHYIECWALNAPYTTMNTFRGIAFTGTLYIPDYSKGYDKWLGTYDYGLNPKYWSVRSANFKKITITGDTVTLLDDTFSFPYYDIEKPYNGNTFTVIMEGIDLTPEMFDTIRFNISGYTFVTLESSIVTPNKIEKTFTMNLSPMLVDGNKFSYFIRYYDDAETINPLTREWSIAADVTFYSLQSGCYADCFWIETETSHTPPITVRKIIKWHTGTTNILSIELINDNITQQYANGYYLGNYSYSTGDIINLTVKISTPLDYIQITGEKCTANVTSWLGTGDVSKIKVNKIGYRDYAQYAEVDYEIVINEVVEGSYDVFFNYEDDFFLQDRGAVDTTYPYREEYPNDLLTFGVKGLFKVDFPDEVPEEVDTEFTVTHVANREITFDAPDEFIFNLIETTDNGDGTVTDTYTLWVDSDFSEESATVYISDGISTIEKIIYITSDIDMASPSINLNYNYLSFPASGGTTDNTFTAEYLNTVMAGVNPPRTTFDDVTIDDYGYTEKETSFKQWHKLTVGATTYERDIPLIFSCVGLDGSSCTEIITAYQSGQTHPIQLTPEYLSVPASGGYFTNAIKAVFSNTSGGQQTTVKTFTRTANGTYVPLDGHSQAWFKCYQNSYGGDTTRTEYYDLKVNENTNTEPFMGVVLFRYTNTYGSTYEREFYLVQDAGDGEVDVKDPEVQPYVTQLKITADGNNAIQTDYRTIQVNYQDCEDGEILDPVCNAEWFRITGSTVVRENEDGKLIQYNWVCDANTGDKARSTEIRFTANVGSTSHIGMVSVQQAFVEPEEPENPADPDNPPYNPDDPDEDRPDIPSIEGVYIGPIWKDVEFDFGAHEKVEYTVFYGPTLIFTGKAWKRPNDVSNKILVNKICQNYLTQGYLDLESLGWEINVNDFTLRSYDGSQVYHTYRFVNDWSYSNYFKAGSLYHPILENQIGVRGQMFPFSILGAGEQVSIQYGVEYFDGYTDKYGNPVEDWNSTEYITNGVSTDFFKVARRDADYIKTVWIGSNRFKLKESCEVPYVMYYLNPWGGFDWFPIQGKVTRKDRMTPYSYTKNYLNTNIGHGNSRYLSEIVPTFTLNTGWLKQIESDRMWYLLQSNVVYLHDLKLDRIYPVVITDQEVEYKQKTRTERILNYTFNVECAQTRERI